MSAYSFLDFVCTITGPGGSINLGQDAGIAEEGITFEAINDKSTMYVGADGSGMHSLSADKSGSIIVRLLKTSPVNAQLQKMYNYQTTSSRLHGRNTIVGRDSSRGDNVTAEGVAFKRQPTLTYAKDAEMLEWTFDAIRISPILGTGTPSIN